MYKVVKTSPIVDPINSVTLVDAISTQSQGLVCDWTANLTSILVTQLSYESSYFFAVLVKNKIGLKALYTPANIVQSKPSNN